jgi:hypothetical protein
VVWIGTNHLIIKGIETNTGVSTGEKMADTTCFQSYLLPDYRYDFGLGRVLGKERLTKDENCFIVYPVPYIYIWEVGADGEKEKMALDFWFNVGNSAHRGLWFWFRQ